MKDIDTLMDAIGMPREYRALAKAIHKQESGGGKADTRRANYAGAIGPMQVTKKTFDGMKQAGIVPPDYDFNNPQHTTLAGLAHVVQLGDSYGGDVRKVAAAYYGGPKAVAEGGQIREFGDKKNPRAPTTVQYANKVANRVADEEEQVGSISRDASGFEQFIAGKVVKPGKQRQQDNVDSLMNDFTENFGGAPEGVTQTALEGGGVEEATTPETAAAPAEPQRTLGQKIGRIGVEIAGGTLGTVLGAATPVPGGALMGGVAGAVGASQIASKTFDPLPPEEAAKEAFYSGAFQLGGGVIGKVAGAVFKPKGLAEGGKELTEILAKKGIVPTPAQAFEGGGLQTLENLGAASLFGAGSLVKARQAATSGVQETAEQWKAKWLVATPQGKRMLENVAQQADNLHVQVPMDDVRNAADAMRKVFTNVDSAGRRAADDVFQLTERNRTLPFAVPFDRAIAMNKAATAQAAATGIAPVPKLVGAQQVRTNLLDVIRNSTNPNEIAAARKTVEVLDKSIAQALAKADPALHAQWRMGNVFYKAGKQGEEISDILSKALVSGGETGEIGGKQLLNQLKDHRIKNLGTDLTAGQLERLNEFGKALKAAEGTGDRAFQFVGRGMQVSGVIQIAAATTAGVGQATDALPKHFTEGALVVALGPVALAKIFASPKTFRMMLAAMKAKPGSTMGAAAGTQFVMQAIQEGIISPTGQQGQMSEEQGLSPERQ